MREPLLFNSILERLNHMILAENIIEDLGPIFACENLITHSSNLAGRKNVERNKKVRFCQVLNLNHYRATISWCAGCVWPFGYCFL